MYSESDIEAAVAAGVLDRAVAESFRQFVANSRGTTPVDEEHLPPIGGFHDAIATIAVTLLLIAIGALSATWGSVILPGAAVAVASAGLAGFFVGKPLMSLPSLLAQVFVGNVAAAAFALLAPLFSSSHLRGTVEHGLALAAASAACAAAAAWLHWRRFPVPITVAAGTAATVGMALALVMLMPGFPPYAT